jgi:hypothetical protein
MDRWPNMAHQAIYPGPPSSFQTQEIMINIWYQIFTRDFFLHNKFYKYKNQCNQPDCMVSTASIIY